MPRYQIGTEESRNCVGSRAARSEVLEEAIKECKEYSRYRHIKSSWLRESTKDGLGPVIATFVKGKQNGL